MSLYGRLPLGGELMELGGSILEQHKQHSCQDNSRMDRPDPGVRCHCIQQGERDEEQSEEEEGERWIISGRTAKSKRVNVICGGTLRMIITERYRRTRAVAL